MRGPTVIDEEPEDDVLEAEVQRRLTAMRAHTTLGMAERLLEDAKGDLNALNMYVYAGEVREMLRRLRIMGTELEYIQLGCDAGGTAAKEEDG